MVDVNKRLRTVISSTQQQIDLLDDEIERQTAYLNALRGEIAKLSDETERLDGVLVTSSTMTEGDRLRKQLSNSTRLNLLLARHNNTLLEMKKAHVQKVNELTSKTQQLPMNPKGEEKIAELERQIQIEKEKIEKFRIPAADDREAIEFIDSGENRSPESIKYAIREQNADFLTKITQMKDHLNQCMDLLERLNGNHKYKVNKLLQTLDSMNQKHQSTVENMNTKHLQTTQTLQQKLTGLSTNYQTIKVNLDALRTNRSKQLSEAMNEVEYLQLICSSSLSQKQVQASTIEDTPVDWRIQMNEKQQLFLDLQRKNQELKREIRRIKQSAILERRFNSIGN